MADTVDLVKDAVESAHDSKLNTWVALLVAMTAVFMALCNVKDGNVVQAMSQAQSHGVDAWSYFQSKSTKQHLAESVSDELETQLALATRLDPSVRAQLAGKLAKYRAEITTYAAEKDSIRKVAEGFATEYDRLNVHDDQFDLADAMFSISVALYGITALTRRRWLLGLALLATLFGAWCGLCGFMGWSFHPSALSGWLG
jgi:hypothetical protein